METPLYNKIGEGYNHSRKADSYLSKIISDWLPNKKEAVLDIGCGSGNYSLSLKNKGFNVFGVDPSDTMLSLAREQSKEIIWTKGSAENIPFDNETFSGIFGTLTLHHWKNYTSAFKELYRVAKPGAKLIFFTATPEQMEGYWLNHYFPKMLEASIIQMPSLQVLTEAASNVGFLFHSEEPYFVTNDLEDYFLYAGKHRPEIYFDENIRKGISSFSALANKTEVKKGLETLKEDLDTGKFEAIKKQFGNKTGDYTFIRWAKAG